MTCTLTVAADLLNKSLGYKYVVYSPKMVKESDCFEFLHSFVGRAPHFRNPNRCLWINPALRTSMFYYYMLNLYFITVLILGTDYHQYDFCVYPEMTKVEKSGWSQALGWLTRNLLGNTPTVEAFTPPTTEEMVKQCLLFYLEPYKNFLLNGYDENFQVEEFVRQVKLIVNHHYTPIVQHHDSSPSPVTVENLKNVCMCNMY